MSVQKVTSTRSKTNAHNHYRTAAVSILWVLVLGLAQGCVTIPPECRTEYAHTLAHCPDIQRRPANAQECKHIGGIAVYENGEYQGCASRQDIQDLMRTYQR